MKQLAFLLIASLSILPGCLDNKKCDEPSCAQPTAPEGTNPIQHREGQNDTPTLGTPQSDDITMGIVIEECPAE